MFRRITKLLTLGCLGSALALGGCAAHETADADENLIAPAGKEDNFFSNVAQEYYVSATPTIRLADSYKGKSFEKREARARKIMEGKTKQIAWFLHVYLIDKSSHDEESDYGGLRAMVLDGSYESDSLRVDPEDELTFTYSFKIQIGGTKELARLIQEDQGLTAGETSFKLKMAKLTNSRLTSFSHSGYSPGDWSPESCSCEIEELSATLEPIEASRDAYVDLNTMIADGVLDISVHFGWDYHARYDIYHAKNFYTWLTQTMKFTSPAASYEQYSRISGPLTKEVTINGKKVDVKVSFFRPDPCVGWDEAGPWGTWSQEVDKDESYKKRACDDYKWSDDADENKEANANPTTSHGAGNLKKDLVNAMQNNDVIIFSGHSGYGYAYALASWYKTAAGDLDPPEIKTMSLPEDKSQLFVISGCDTYHVGQAFKENPNKLGLHNADVITTTSFSNSADLDDTKDIIMAFAGDRRGKVTAMTYGKLMSKLNSSTTLPSWKHSFYTMYGIHGIDDNPTLNPLGDASKSCQPCTKDADCGAAGNVCVRLNDDEKVCATECVHDSGCGEGQVCRKFGSYTYGYLKGMACVPKSLSCKVDPIEDPTDKSFKAEGTVSAKEEVLYEIPVGPTARNIEVKLTGTNDADLYTNFLARPEKRTYKCRPYKYGSNETCTHKTISGDTLYVMVRGWASLSEYQLQVTWD